MSARELCSLKTAAQPVFCGIMVLRRSAGNAAIQLKDEWKVSGPGNGIGGYEAVKQMLQCAELPTALFVQTSRMNSGILAALRDGNIAVPGQMEIIAYGDGDFSQYLYPTVTVLHVSVSEMAANAMHLLLTILQNDLHITLSKLHDDEN